MESDRTYYIILHHTRPTQNVSYTVEVWTIVERSGMFWVIVVQGRVKREIEVNKSKGEIMTVGV